MWVLPGGNVDTGESYRETAERELAEEAGIGAEYEGLGVLVRADLRCGDHHTWGILPLFQARADGHALTVNDPDGEITEARWFDELPEDTRDREYLREWREWALDVSGTVE